jgi:transposase-like protein
LRPIYTAPTAAAAADRLTEFAERWADQHPSATKISYTEDQTHSPQNDSR